ncbi:MAG: putative E3 ubiquitin-protein ligase [Streblomastix strix]|uniref:Putative E3 ubiquitin-protein ligase n=1 Tax=Streblomastix strix TaxID=222440 RepID=A0A5J4WFH1_9EUKA|nr:MAG: putative E3 ubiquitin-protein ligase [Streblomastix strix]
MAREIAWVTDPDEHTRSSLQLASQQTFFVVQEMGPCARLIRDTQGKKFRVSIGSINVCQCQKKRGEYCVHIGFLLGFSQAQYMREQSIQLKTSSDEQQPATVEQRPILSDSTCPVCLEVINIKQPVSYCKYGCGNSLHTSCLVYWSQHNRSEKNSILCPFCRSSWGQIETSIQPRSTCPFVHLKSKCRCCGMIPIIGPKLTCMICSDYYICVPCYKSGFHSVHSSFYVYETQYSKP